MIQRFWKGLWLKAFRGPGAYNGSRRLRWWYCKKSKGHYASQSVQFNTVSTTVWFQSYDCSKRLGHVNLHDPAIFQDPTFPGSHLTESLQRYSKLQWLQELTEMILLALNWALWDRERTVSTTVSFERYGWPEKLDHAILQNRVILRDPTFSRSNIAETLQWSQKHIEMIH